MTDFENAPERSPADIEVAAAIAAENNQEIFAEKNHHLNAIEKVKGFIGRVATVFGEAHRDGSIDPK